MSHDYALDDLREVTIYCNNADALTFKEKAFDRMMDMEEYATWLKK